MRSSSWRCIQRCYASHRTVTQASALPTRFHSPAIATSALSDSEQIVNNGAAGGEAAIRAPADSGLFESLSNEYVVEEEAALAAKHDIWDTGPTHLLNSLLKKNVKEATATLEQLKRLETAIEPQFIYARPARQCADEGDVKGYLRWLDSLPEYYSATHEQKVQREQACANLSAALVALINGSAEPYVVCVALLKTAAKGYLEAEDRGANGVTKSLTWLVRHGKVDKQDEDKEWTWQLWESLVKSASDARNRQADDIEKPSSSKVTLEHSDVSPDLAFKLNRLYNACLRSLTLSGRYDAATYWVQRSDSLAESIGSVTGTALFPFTWRLYLEEIMDEDSPASQIIRSRAGALAAALKEKAAREPMSSRLRSLVQEMRTIVVDRNAGLAFTGETPWVDRVGELLGRNDYRGCIALLNHALIEAKAGPRWIHLPKASTLAAVRTAVAKSQDRDAEEALDDYITRLKQSKGAKGLIDFSTMFQLSLSRRHADCIAACVNSYQSREIEQLAIELDAAVFGQIVQKAKGKSKLQSNKYASYLALKSLALLCEHDFFRLHRLYQSWLQQNEQYARRGASDGVIHTESPDEYKGLFEESDLDYLFSGEVDIAEEEARSPLLTHQSPPSSRPTAFHFNLFLKLLPKSMNVSSYRGSSSAQALLPKQDVHSKSIDLAFRVLKEMERFRVEPTASTWSILLTLLARNIDHSPLEGMEARQQDSIQWTRLWRLTSALGMGSGGRDAEAGAGKVGNTSTTASSSSTLPRATALTYANLIYAFLMVPPSRGGPFLTEAEKVKDWFEADPVALSNAQQYERPLQRVMLLLERLQAKAASQQQDVEGHLPEESYRTVSAIESTTEDPFIHVP